METNYDSDDLISLHAGFHKQSDKVNKNFRSKIS